MGIRGLIALGLVLLVADPSICVQAADRRLTVSTTSNLARESSRKIGDHKESYSIETAGAGAPQNLSLQIENTGDNAVVNPKIIVNKGPDWSSIDSILTSVLQPEMTDDQKARTIWQFAREHRYHWWPPSQQTREDNDPVKLFGIYGYGMCSNVAAAMAAMFERAGMPSRFWTLGDDYSHEVSEAWYEGSWHLLDADRDGLYLKRDNQTIAGVEDLIDDPNLVARAGTSHHDLVRIYASTPKSRPVPAQRVYAVGHEIELTLRPHESLSFNWQGGDGYHDDMVSNQKPPIYGNAQLISRVDLRDKGYRRWIAQESNVRSAIEDDQKPSLSPSSAGTPGELVYLIDSPYPIIKASLSANLYRKTSADTVEIYVDRPADGVNLLGPEIGNNMYRIPGMYISESNLNSYATDGNWPPIHTTYGLCPAQLTYLAKPLQKTGNRVVVGGEFFRYLQSDYVGMSISRNGVNWQTIWNAYEYQSDPLIGYFEHLEDITDRVKGWDSFLLRYEFQALSLNSSYGGWTAGITAISLSGVEPPGDRMIWSTSSNEPLGSFKSSIDLTPVVAPPVASAAYHYQIRIVMRSPNSGLDVGLDAFTLMTTVQVAPGSLPSLQLGVNQVEYSDLSSDPVEVLISHRWAEDTGPSPLKPPPTPTSPVIGGSIDAGKPFLLAWEPAIDSEGAGIHQYHIEICNDPDCRWPVSGIFDTDLTEILPGPDGIMRTNDDMRVPIRATSWVVPFYDWFVPGRVYYWRVRVQDIAIGRWSEYSPTWSFRFGDLPTNQSRTQRRTPPMP